jgi:hypothetical protein
MAAGWTAEEESKVLSFYALDDVFPERWPDDEGLALATGTAEPDALNPVEIAPETPIEGQYLDGDALGIVRNLARYSLKTRGFVSLVHVFDATFVVLLPSKGFL